ncbi:MAG TPA: type I methionyl aminopeptidase, partial [Acidobacteriota bacterium]|nr:type I methionyl aminopeptidase [Acidobacteriota bacterium]
YRGFPASLCISINEEIVHGIPRADRILQEGDVASVDVGARYRGFYGDAAGTFPVGDVGPEKKRLLDVTNEALWVGIGQAQVGNRLSDISAAVQRHVESHGYSVVRDFVGHGIGRNLHEEPQVPNFGEPGRGPRLKAGMVLAIEPMVNEGGPEARLLEDRWTAVTQDGSWSAHFEHTVAITEAGPWILTLLDGEERLMA